MRSDQDLLREIIPLLKSDEKNRLYFFSKRKEPRWFPYLIEEGLFESSMIPEPVRTANGFTLPVWPQADYLEHLSGLIRNKSVTDPKFISSYLGVLRGIDSLNSNFLLARTLFLSLIRVGPKYLTSKDIDRAFRWVIDSGGSDTLMESGVHEGLEFLITDLENNASERDVFQAYLRGLFNVSSKQRDDSSQPKLQFFTDYGFKQFYSKRFRLDEIAKSKPFVLYDGIEVVERALLAILADTQIDQRIAIWRPAVERHSQNKFHDSAQSILIELLYSMAAALLTHKEPLPKAEKWGEFEFFTFKRIYFALAAMAPDQLSREVCARRIVELGFESNCRHEVFLFLKEQFDALSDQLKNEVLNKIDSIVEESSDSEELAKRYTAWEKLRWLEALTDSTNEGVIALRKEQLLITEGKIPEHPDFSTYMSGGWVGPASPKTVEELSRTTPEDIFTLLTTFEDSKEFHGPDTTGLARTLEEFVLVDPVKCSALIPKLLDLKYQYISALLDGYSKAWNGEKYVPVRDIASTVRQLVENASFAKDIATPDTKADWVISSIGRFIESGTRDDENAFPTNLDETLHRILRKCVELCSPDARYDSHSDAYSRAINEPRGRLFEALIVLALRRARTSNRDSAEFNKAWADLREIIEPLLVGQDPKEISLHALMGAYYRQVSFLSGTWIYEKIELIAPPPEKLPMLWRSFMDGFCYVTAYVREMYEKLKERGDLLKYLRNEHPNSNSKTDRLQHRVIELALVAYVLCHEDLTEDVIGSIIKEEDPEEWHVALFSINSVIGENPKPEHLARAIAFINKLLDIRDLKPSDSKWKQHFSGLGRLLELLHDPSDPAVARIFRIVASDKSSPWEVNDLIEYLHQFKDSHPTIVGELYETLLSISNIAPTWPAEKVREVCQALVDHSETERMLGICRYYAERSFSCEPIRDICARLKAQ